MEMKIRNKKRNGARAETLQIARVQHFEPFQFQEDGLRSNLNFDCKNGTKKSPEQFFPGFPYTWKNHVFGQGNFLVFFGTFYFPSGLNVNLIPRNS